MIRTFPLAPFAGVNKDLATPKLPVGAVTDTNNMRYREGVAEPILGQIAAYGTPPIAPISSFPLQIGEARYWIVLSQTKAYAVTGQPAVWTNITRQNAGADVNYAANLGTLWNGGVLNGVPFLNNGVDPPQMLSPVSVGQRLQTLTAWPANTTCRVMRPFRNFLFAFDVTMSGNRFPHRVMYSTAAEPGTVPASWTASPSNDAGSFDLEGSGFVIDALPLGGNLVVYKERSAHLATLNGASFSFQLLFSGTGMLAPDCGVEIDGRHYLLTSNDVVVHAGSNPTSIVDKATRRWLFQNIDPQQYDKCFVTKNVYFNEILVCFPQLGATACNRALVYNYKDGTTSFRSLPDVTSANNGLVQENISQTWESDTEQWQDDITAWQEIEFGAQLERTMFCAPSRPALVLTDASTRSFGALIPGYIERVGLDMGDPNKTKTISRLRPRFRGPRGVVINFRVGGSMELNGSYEWSEAIPFTIGVSKYVDRLISGKQLAWRIDFTTASNWRLDALDVDLIERGKN